MDPYHVNHCQLQTWQIVQSFYPILVWVATRSAVCFLFFLPWWWMKTRLDHVRGFGNSPSCRSLHFKSSSRPVRFRTHSQCANQMSTFCRLQCCQLCSCSVATLHYGLASPSDKFSTAAEMLLKFRCETKFPSSGLFSQCVLLAGDLVA